MRFFGKTQFDFMGKRSLWYKISGTVILIGLLSIAFKGFHYGIDFLGGTELIVEFNQAPDYGKIRTMLSENGFPKSELKGYGEETRVLIRTDIQGEGMVVGTKIKEALDKSFPELSPKVLQEQKIGAKIGNELRKDALYAIIASLFAIGIYIAFRFEFIFGVGAIAALLHDVLVTLGFVSIFDGVTAYTSFEIDQNMVAAFLTIVGLSVNDTVVIFDRIRENRKIYRSMPLIEIINKSLNETLSRTIITSGTIFLITLILFFLGGEVNRGFAFALTVGITTGTYSSIYIASAVVLDYTNRKAKKSGAPVMKDKSVYEPIAQ